MKKKILMLAAMLCLSAANSQALTLTLNHNQPGAYLASGSSLLGSFDLASHLPTGTGMAYTLSSAVVTFLFGDDGDDLTTRITTGEWMDRDNGNGNQIRYQDAWSSNSPEKVSATLAGQTLTGATSYYQAELKKVGESSYSVGTGNNKIKYTTVERSGEKGYRGGIDLALTPDVSLFSNLSDISFVLQMIEGDVNYLSGVMTAEFDEQPVVFAGNGALAPVPAPEPSTVALLGLGLAGLACAARRMKKNNRG